MEWYDNLAKPAWTPSPATIPHCKSVRSVGYGFRVMPLRRPWYCHKQEPAFADLFTTLRRVSYEEKTEHLQPKASRLKTWITQLTELLSRMG